MYIISITAQSSTDQVITNFDQLFTSNVEIVDYELLPSNSTGTYDNDARLLRVGAHAYSYPASIESISQVTSLSEGTLVIDVRENTSGSTNSVNSSFEWVWYFDTQTESFTRFVNRCDERMRLSHVDIDSPWIYVTGDRTDQVHLCELATGEISSPLPSNLLWEIQPPFSTSPVPIFASLDGHWLLLFGADGDQIYIFSYDTLSDQLTELGQVTCSFCIERDAVRWFGSRVTIWLLVGDSHAIYSANVTRLDNLELAFTRPNFLPEFYENPPRYDFINFTTPEDIWDRQCEHVIYDVLSEEMQITDMGASCRLEYGSLDGIGYYRDVTQGANGIAALTRFNAETGQSEILYEAEIELIEWISPDEQYAVLVMGSNDRIDILPTFPPPWILSEAPKLAYVDLVNDTVVFEQWTAWYQCDEPIGGPSWSWSNWTVVEGGLSETSVRPCSNMGLAGAILPREDGTLLAIGTFEPQYLYVPFDSTEFADLISIHNELIERTRIAEGSLTSFSSDYIVSYEQDNAQYIQYSMIPVNGGSILEITNPVSSDDYEVLLTDVYPSMNRLRFHITPNPEINPDALAGYVTVQVINP